MISHPYISVVVPVNNGEKFLPACLAALASSSYPEFELIVVDDCSNDRSVEISQQVGARVLKMSRQSGPGAARNLGAEHARGQVLFFVDADVVVRPNSLEQVASSFSEHPNIAAVFGSYDDEPAEANFISQYKNLFHRFVHQQALSDSVTFWAGCGAIRRDIFLEFHGFDAKRYQRPAIEDIELGYRMHSQGHRILINKELQGKHLKRWTLRSMLQADIFQRAIPWSTLIFERKGMVNDLNLRVTDRICAALLGLALLLLPFSMWNPRLLVLVAVMLAVILILNHKLYRYFFERKGLTFAILAFPLHMLYYLYSAVAFVLCWFAHVFRRGFS